MIELKWESEDSANRGANEATRKVLLFGCFLLLLLCFGHSERSKSPPTAEVLVASSPS